MRLQSLSHLIEVVCAVARPRKVIIFGSSSLLLGHPELGNTGQALELTTDADFLLQPVNEAIAESLQVAAGRESALPRQRAPLPPLPADMWLAPARKNVAQISNLPCRRASSLRGLGRLGRARTAKALPIGKRRQSRLETCAALNSYPSEWERGYGLLRQST